MDPKSLEHAVTRVYVKFGKLALFATLVLAVAVIAGAPFSAWWIAFPSAFVGLPMMVAAAASKENNRD